MGTADSKISNEHNCINNVFCNSNIKDPLFPAITFIAFPLSISITNLFTWDNSKTTISSVTNPIYPVYLEGLVYTKAF